MADIMKKVKEQPVVAAMRVGDDFSEWANGEQIGIYGPIRVPEGDSLRKHNVVIIGFGLDKITERYYWLIVTSRSASVLKVYMYVVMKKPRNSDVWEYLVFETSYPIPHIKRKRVEEEVI